MGTTEREILQAPIEIGTTEIKSYQLLIPPSWGTGDLSNAAVTVENKKEAVISGAVSGSPTTNEDADGTRSVLFTLDGTALVRGYDYTVYVSVDVGDDTQVSKGVWKCRK